MAMAIPGTRWLATMSSAIASNRRTSKSRASGTLRGRGGRGAGRSYAVATAVSMAAGAAGAAPAVAAAAAAWAAEVTSAAPAASVFLAVRAWAVAASAMQESRQTVASAIQRDGVRRGELAFIGSDPCVCSACRPMIAAARGIAWTRRTSMVSGLILLAILVGLAVVAGGWAVGTYNGLVTARNAY